MALTRSRVGDGIGMGVSGKRDQVRDLKKRGLVSTKSVEPAWLV